MHSWVMKNCRYANIIMPVTNVLEELYTLLDADIGDKEERPGTGMITFGEGMQQIWTSVRQAITEMNRKNAHGCVHLLGQAIDGFKFIIRQAEENYPRETSSVIVKAKELLAKAASALEQVKSTGYGKTYP